MQVRGSMRRRGVAISAAALALILIAPALVHRAGAVVANPGNIEVSMSLSIATPTLDLQGMQSAAPAQATVRANGSILIPQEGMAFAPLDVSVGAPNPELGDVRVQLVAAGDFAGVIDPASGALWLTGALEEMWSQTNTMSNCAVGPFTVLLSTHNPGVTKYTASTGTATIVDGNFAVPAVAPKSTGCGGLEAAINATIGLPVTTTTSTTTTTVPAAVVPKPPDVAPVPGVVLSLTFTPAPMGGRTPPPPPPPTTATTTARPTTTTAVHSTITTTPHATPSTRPGSPPTVAPQRATKSAQPPNNNRQKIAAAMIKRAKAGHATGRHAKTRKHKKARKLVVRHPVARTPAVASGPPTTVKSYGAGAGAFRKPFRRVPPRVTPVRTAPVASTKSGSSTGVILLMVLGLVPLIALGVGLIGSEVARTTRRGRRHRVQPVNTDD